MNNLQNYTGSKICETCFHHAIISYVFINKTHSLRSRLSVCIGNMLENLQNFTPEDKVFIEIDDNGIMPITDSYDENLLLCDDEVDDRKLKVDVLEDEFRLKSESDESSSEEAFDVSLVRNKYTKKTLNKKSKLTNGYTNANDNLNEFLTFKSKGKHSAKKKYVYKCPICAKKFISDYFLRKHVAKHRNKIVECSLCLNIFQSKFHLREHNRVLHLLKLNNFYSCFKCGRTFKTEQRLLVHAKQHFISKCDLCDKVFRSTSYLLNHMQLHLNKFRALKRKKPRSCSFCEERYANENDLSIHVNKIHLQIKPYCCDMCDKQFYTDLDMKKHKKVHSVKSIEKCEFCSVVLKTRKDLVVHIRKHMGRMPYTCLVCPKKFYSESQVRRHMRKLHGGSEICKICKIVFAKRKDLKLHVNTAHTLFGLVKDENFS